MSTTIQSNGTLRRSDPIPCVMCGRVRDLAFTGQLTFSPPPNLQADPYHLAPVCVPCLMALYDRIRSGGYRLPWPPAPNTPTAEETQS